MQITDLKRREGEHYPVFKLVRCNMKVSPSSNSDNGPCFILTFGKISILVLFILGMLLLSSDWKS